MDATRPAHASRTDAPRVRPHVLVVDDAPVMRFAVGELLRRAGFDVTTAADGRDALATLEASAPPTLVVTDLAMPQLDGRALCAAMAADPKLAAVPVVVLSSERPASVAGLANVRAFVAKDADVARSLLDALRPWACER